MPILTEKLNECHLNEWKKSCVSQSLVDANEIKSLTGDEPYEYLLAFHDAQRRNDGRLTAKELKRYDHCTDGGWWFGSVSVRTGELTDYGCFKPDNPLEDENGKLIKYEAPKGAKPQLLAMNIPVTEWQKISDRYNVPMSGCFYQWLHEHPEVPLIITEGGKKLGCLITAGYASVAVSGWTHLYSKDPETGERKLNEDLAYLCNGKRTIYFALDQDINNKTRKQIHTGIKRTAGLIKAHNSACTIKKVTWTGAKGVDDFIALNGEEAFATQVKRAKTVTPIAPDYDDAPSRPSLLISPVDRKIAHIEQCMGELKFNDLTKQIEEDGKNLEDLHLLYLREDIRNCWDLSNPDRPFHLPIGQTFCEQTVEAIAKNNRYHPVKDFLDNLDVTPLAQQDWHNIAGLLLKKPDPLSNAILKRCLIACVARIYEPACINRLVTILTGTQKAGKSTFWRYLASDAFFSDSLGNLKNLKDDYLTLHSSWILEWSEFDKITSKRESSETKAFVTKVSDDFRPPYARHVQRFPRMNIIVGTSNRSDFLKNDPSGNTRYGVIEVDQPIDLERVLSLRERIWATAKQAYLNGESWELTPEELALSEQNNLSYQEIHPWEELITRFLEGKQTVTSNEILGECLSIEMSRRTVRENRIVSDILRKNGWIQDQHPSSTPHYGRVRVWRLSESANTENSPLSFEDPLPSSSPDLASEVTETAETTTPTIFEEDSIEWAEIIQAIDAELMRVNWSVEEARQHLIDNYGKNSRQLLTDPELFEFCRFLESITP